MFDENAEEEALENQRQTELTAFFDFNRKSIEQGLEPENLPTYVQMPEEYRYEKKLKKWIKRKQKGVNVIGRVHSIHPVAGETFFLRTLLHDDHCRGKTSFQDLMTLSNGRLCETFKDACNMLGLLSDDSEWKKVLEDSAVTKMCPAIRELFVTILLFCLPTNPLTLFNEFWTTWYDDIQHKAARRGVTLISTQNSQTLDLQKPVSGSTYLLMIGKVLHSI